MDEFAHNIIWYVAICFGTLLCFRGYRFFRALMTTYGFLIGATIGYLLGIISREQEVIIILSLICGISGALIVNLVYTVSIFLVGALFGAFVFQLLSLLLGQQLHVIIAIIFLVTGGILALRIMKFAIILGTSFMGSSTIITGVYVLLGAQEELYQNYSLNFEHNQSFIMAILMILLGIIGVSVQYKKTFGVSAFKTDIYAHLKSEWQGHKEYTRDTTNTLLHLDTQKTDNIQKEISKSSGFCKNCGQKINLTAKFCKHCGVANSHYNQTF